MNSVIDRFGKDISIKKVDKNHFHVRVNVAVSPTFFAWVFQFGNKAKIMSPDGVVEKYKELLKHNLENHNS